MYVRVLLKSMSDLFLTLSITQKQSFNSYEQMLKYCITKIDKNEQELYKEYLKLNQVFKKFTLFLDEQAVSFIYQETRGKLIFVLLFQDQLAIPDLCGCLGSLEW
jgi:hypothetical protein